MVREGSAIWAVTAPELPLLNVNCIIFACLPTHSYSPAAGERSHPGRTGGRTTAETEPTDVILFGPVDVPDDLSASAWRALLESVD